MSGEGLIPNRIDAGNGRKRIPRGTVICPVCEANGHIHGVEHVTPLVKTLWCRCTNLACCMSWRMQLSFEYVISPSGISHPDLQLPQVPASLAQQIHAGPPANEMSGLHSQTGPPGRQAA